METASDAELELGVAASMRPFDITLTCVALNSQTGDSSVMSHPVKVIPAKGAMTRTAAA